MTYEYVKQALKQGHKIVDTRGVFVAAAGPYISPGLGGVPGAMLDELRESMGLVMVLGPLGLPAYCLPRFAVNEIQVRMN